MAGGIVSRVQSCAGKADARATVDVRADGREDDMVRRPIAGFTEATELALPHAPARLTGHAALFWDHAAELFGTLDLSGRGRTHGYAGWWPTDRGMNERSGAPRERATRKLTIRFKR